MKPKLDAKVQKPPDNSKAEVTAAIVKGAVSAIHIVGGIISEPT